MGTRSVDEVLRAAVAADDDVRLSLLSEGLLAHGTRFVLAGNETSDALASEIEVVLEYWFDGGRLSDRADEPERRVRVAQELHELDADPPSGRWLASSMLELAQGHQLRDVPLATELLGDEIASARRDGDAYEELAVITVQVRNGVGDDAQLDTLVARGDELAQEPDVDAESFLDAVQTHLMQRLSQAEQDRDQAAVEQWKQALLERTENGEDDLDRALRLQAEGQHAAAAECWARIVEANDLADSPIQQFALEEARCLVRARFFAQAVDVLQSAMGYAEHTYIQAVRAEDVDDAGERVGTMATLLALAHANTGEWGQVPVSLDRGRALRLRHLAAVRGAPGSEVVFEPQRAIERSTRMGVPSDELAELLERHRTALRDIDVPLPRSPTTPEIAAALPQGEAVAILALHPTATVGAVIVPGDDDQPSGRMLDADWDRDTWLSLLADDGDRQGWASVLVETAAGNSPARPSDGLDLLMQGADEAVGWALRDVLDEHGISRLTIVTSELLLLVPWWALESLANIDVVMATTLADVPARQLPAEPMPRRALLVSNPTGDARTSSLASTACRSRLQDAGVAVEPLDGPDATQAAVQTGLDGAGLLHFAGHGRWTDGQGVLELHAEAVADPNRELLTAQPTADDGTSSADRAPADQDALWIETETALPVAGILHERRWLAGPRVDRWLQDPDSTLMATFHHRQLVRVSRLWSAGEMLLGEAFRTCQLCVLTACESAIPGSGMDVAHAGLPSALTVAGVDTVVGTLWPIEERFAAVWVGCFYDQLARKLEAGQSVLDVAGLVRDVAAQVRAMSSADAAARLLALAPLSGDPLTSLTLEAEAHTLADKPFQPAWFWASFYVTGSPVLTVKEPS